MMDKACLASESLEIASRGLASALAQWRAILSPSYVLTGRAAARMICDTDWQPQSDFVLLRPADRQQVAAVLRVAASEGVSLHPVSTGRNWGYGGARPPSPDTRVVVHLGRMTRITAFDATTGLVTLEPGVTQAMLTEFLRRHGDRYMTPTTGAGPGCSLVGNALERGYGLTPHADHFAAVMGLEAILPDGRLYRSPLTTGDAEDGHLGRTKWGCGPYLDGLFSQGAAGIVTRMTLALARRPERVESFYFWIDRDQKLEATVDAVQDLLASAGGPVGGINLVNAARVALMVPADAGLPRAAWTGTGALYGDAGQVAATRHSIRRRIGPLASRILFLNRDRLRWLHRLRRLVVFPRLAKRLQTLLASTESVLKVLEGEPTEFALPLAYAGLSDSDRATIPLAGLDPARDGCGVLWFAPVIAMNGPEARRYTRMVAAVCERHGFEAALTLSSLSAAAFDSTLPLLFTPTEAHSQRAHRCFAELVRIGRSEGFLPYRYASTAMEIATEEPEVFWQLARQVKHSLDPQGLISPGRYHAATAPSS